MSTVVSTGEKVLELTELHRKEAQIYERRGMEDSAKLLRSVADEYESLVRGALPDWITLDQAQQAKGWSDRWWRDRCRELEADGLARKRSGRWEIHRSALPGIPRKPGRHEEIEIEGDIREVAAKLAED